MPRWFSGYQSRFLVTDLFGVTTAWLDRLTLGASLAFNLDQPMTGNIAFHSNDPRVNRIFTPDNDPRVAQSNRLIYTFLRQGTDPLSPWVNIGNGILMSPEDQADADVPTTHATFYDAWQFLFGTPCFTDLSGGLPGPDGFQFFSVPGAEIVATLLGNAIVGSPPDVFGTGGNGYFIDAGPTYGGTTFWAGTLEATPPIDFVVQQGQTVGDAWNQLLTAGEELGSGGSSGGIDIVLQPIYDPVNRPGYTHDLSVFNLAGVDQHGAPMAWGEFTRTATTADRQHDGTPGAFVDYADFFAGQGGPGNGPIQNASVSSKYLRYWSQQWFPQQPNAFVVQAMAQQVIQLQAQGKRTFTVNPDPLRAIGPFVGYNLGDRIPILAPNRLRVAATGLQRVQGIPLEINPDGVARVNALLTTPDWRGKVT